MEGHLMTDPKRAYQYMLGGNATFSLKNVTSGNHMTYRVSAPRNDGGVEIKRPDVFFVGVNTGDGYLYMGIIPTRTMQFRLTAKSRVGVDAPSALGFNMLLWNLQHGKFPKNSEFWHNGSCGVCGRTLTNPESIESGIGPVCSGRVSKYNF